MKEKLKKTIKIWLVLMFLTYTLMTIGCIDESIMENDFITFVGGMIYAISFFYLFYAIYLAYKIQKEKKGDLHIPIEVDDKFYICPKCGNKILRVRGYKPCCSICGNKLYKEDIVSIYWNKRILFRKVKCYISVDFILEKMVLGFIYQWNDETLDETWLSDIIYLNLDITEYNEVIIHIKTKKFQDSFSIGSGNRKVENAKILVNRIKEKYKV